MTARTNKRPNEGRPEVELRDNLERILRGVAKAHVHKLENTDLSELSAAELTSAQKFLQDNSTRVDTLADTQENTNAAMGTAVQEAREQLEHMEPLPAPRLGD